MIWLIVWPCGKNFAWTILWTSKKAISIVAFFYAVPIFVFLIAMVLITKLLQCVGLILPELKQIYVTRNFVV